MTTTILEPADVLRELRKRRIERLVQVISLPQREDRRALFAQHALDRCITAVFVPGQLHADPRVGINAAHKACVARAIEAGLPYVTIMEDDCLFPAPDGWMHYLLHARTPCDVYLGGTYGGDPLPDGTVGGWCGMHCYTVYAPYYATFLNAPPTENIDVALSRLGGRFRVCMPYAAVQRNGYSDHIKKHMNYAEWNPDKVYHGPTS